MDLPYLKFHMKTNSEHLCLLARPYQQINIDEQGHLTQQRRPRTVAVVHPRRHKRAVGPRQGRRLRLLRHVGLFFDLPPFHPVPLPSSAVLTFRDLLHSPLISYARPMIERCFSCTFSYNFCSIIFSLFRCA
uniref:Uncharacterized protein n=1 Tax=Aegilops tauschii subsp. strangulata TaxID=200361 RepID=A0A453DKP8_AEGTS